MKSACKSGSPSGFEGVHKGAIQAHRGDRLTRSRGLELAYLNNSPIPRSVRWMGRELTFRRQK
jgi:hypothetical protein